MMVPARFDRYEIVRKLGRSMTDVYLAFDPVLKLHVVLKLVEQSSDHFTQVVIEAERRGAEIQEQLHAIDSRVLEVYEFGEKNGYFFVAMEYFDGRNIAEILESERRLDPRLAARYAVEVLSQLERLHSFVTDLDGRRRAVVHGDIKPSNIQIGSNGEVRLLDFGIAKVITHTNHLTHHNLGSPTYCSPERLENSQVDPQADLWAFGVSLYEMVSGSLPYQAASTRKLEILIQSRRPPRALPAKCPENLRAIILKALGPQAQDRYASAADFAGDLQAFLDGRPAKAESEIPYWDAHETVKKERPPRARWIPVLSKSATGALRAIAAGIAIGLLLVIPIHYLLGFQRDVQPFREPRDYTRLSAAEMAFDWSLYQRLLKDGGFFGRWSSAPALAQSFRQRLLAAADAVLEKYRYSSDPALANFEWSKARLALTYALQIDPSDLEARGKLALCDGYLNLIRNPQLPKSDQSEISFQVAAADLPRSPDPHLALAYFYTYVLPNAGKAMGEFAEADHRGFRTGPREIEQQADAYVYRAEYEIRQAQLASGSPTAENRWLRQAFSDLDRARDRYEPVAGFSNVNAGLDRLYRDRASAQQLSASIAADGRKAVEQRAAEQRAAEQRAKMQRPIRRGPIPAPATTVPAPVFVPIPEYPTYDY